MFAIRFICVLLPISLVSLEKAPKAQKVSKDSAGGTTMKIYIFPKSWHCLKYLNKC